MTTKHCSGHGRAMPVSEFGPNRAKKDGLQDRCRQCARTDSRLSKQITRAAARDSA